MRPIVLIMLLLACGASAIAQDAADPKKSLLYVDNKDIFFADIGTTGDGAGASVTYNRKLFKHFGVGGGMQGYNTLTSTHNLVNIYQFIPAIYADMRGYIPAGKSLLFYMLDLGVDIYKVKNAAYPYDDHTNGFYTGLGFGYCYRITRRGAGPYATIRIISDTYTTQSPPTPYGVGGKSTNSNATSVISIGFKF